MKYLAMLFLLAGSFAYPQDQQTATTTATPTTEKFDFKARFTWYAKRTYVDPWSHANLIAAVTIDDFAFGGLKGWGSGLSGWGRSLAPVYGQRVVNNTSEFLLGSFVFHDDARYQLSKKRGLAKRGLHATVGAFTALGKNGGIQPAYSRIIAVAASILIANRWRSNPEIGGNLTRNVVFGVTDKIQDDLLREFSPELKRLGHRVGHAVWRKIHHDRKTIHP